MTTWPLLAGTLHYVNFAGYPLYSAWSGSSYPKTGSLLSDGRSGHSSQQGKPNWSIYSIQQASWSHSIMVGFAPSVYYYTRQPPRFHALKVAEIITRTDPRPVVPLKNREFESFILLHNILRTACCFGIRTFLKQYNVLSISDLELYWNEHGCLWPRHRLKCGTHA